MHGNRNGGVRAKFEAWNRKWRSSSQIPMLGIGNKKESVIIIKIPYNN